MVEPTQLAPLKDDLKGTSSPILISDVDEEIFFFRLYVQLVTVMLG